MKLLIIVLLISSTMSGLSQEKLFFNNSNFGVWSSFGDKELSEINNLEDYESIIGSYFELHIEDEKLSFHFLNSNKSLKVDYTLYTDTANIISIIPLDESKEILTAIYSFKADKLQLTSVENSLESISFYKIQAKIEDTISENIINQVDIKQIENWKRFHKLLLLQNKITFNNLTKISNEWSRMIITGSEEYISPKKK